MSLVDFGVFDILKLQSIDTAGVAKADALAHLLKVSTSPLESSMALGESDLSELRHHPLT